MPTIPSSLAAFSHPTSRTSPEAASARSSSPSHLAPGAPGAPARPAQPTSMGPGRPPRPRFDHDTATAGTPRRGLVLSSGPGGAIRAQLQTPTPQRSRSATLPPDLDPHSESLRRAGALLDHGLLKGSLKSVQTATVINLHDEVQQMLAHLGEDGAAERLCAEVAALMPQGSSAMARLSALRALLREHQEADGTASEAVDRAVVSLSSMLGTSSQPGQAGRPYLTALRVQLNETRARDLMGRPRSAYESVASLELLQACIDPPEALRDRWSDRDQAEFAKFISPRFVSSSIQVLDAVERVLPTHASPYLVAMLCLGLARQHHQDRYSWRDQGPRAAAAEQFIKAQLQDRARRDELGAALAILLPLSDESRGMTLKRGLQLSANHPSISLPVALEALEGRPDEEAQAIVRHVALLVPPWADAEPAARMLEVVSRQSRAMRRLVASVWPQFVRPQMTVDERSELFDALIVLCIDQDEQKMAPLDQQARMLRLAQAINDPTRAVPAAAISGMVEAKALSRRDKHINGYMRAVLNAQLGDQEKGDLMRRLTNANRGQRAALLAAGLTAASSARAATAATLRSTSIPETAMFSGRISASDAVIAAVRRRVPSQPRWREIIRDIAAYIEAARHDVHVDPLLMRADRNGHTELDNASNTLMGGLRDGDHELALMYNPTYVLGTGETVPLGELVATLWHLLEHAPVPAATPAQQARDLRRVRDDMILALARATEADGARVCGWGMSEGLIEACSGNIAGLPSPTIVYPQTLLAGLNERFARRHPNPNRIRQEAFYHGALATARKRLQSGAAYLFFGQQLDAFMVSDYGWPAR